MVHHNLHEDHRETARLSGGPVRARVTEVSNLKIGSGGHDCDGIGKNGLRCRWCAE